MIFTVHSYNGGNCGNNRKRTHIAVQTYTNCEGVGGCNFDYLCVDVTNYNVHTCFSIRQNWTINIQFV